MGAVKDFDERGLGEVGEIDLHAVAKASGELVVYGDGGHFGKKCAGVGEEGFEFFGCGSFELVDGDGVGKGEGAGKGSAEG